MGTDLEIRPGPDSPVDEAPIGVEASSAAPQTMVWPPSCPVATITPQAEAPDGGRRLWGRRFWRDVCLGGVVVMLAHVFVVQVSVVRGLSMAPSLQDGDRLMVDKVSYSVANVSRFDVVVLRYPRNPDVDFVKRVVGLPGDRIALHDGLLHVNGTALSEEFTHVADATAEGSWVVPAGKYFVLGDNRPISCDSREFGMVAHELLKGKVRVRFWPLDRFEMF